MINLVMIMLHIFALLFFIPALLVTHDPDDVPAGGRVIEISEFSEFSKFSIGEVRRA